MHFRPEWQFYQFFKEIIYDKVADTQYYKVICLVASSICICKINYVEHHMIILTNKKNIPIGLSYRDQVYEKIRIM